jgi:hypothetical protein
MDSVHSLYIYLIVVYFTMDLQEVGGGCGNGWSGLRIGSGGGHL